MQTIYLTEKANTWSITQLNEWKHLQSQFLFSLQPICLNVFLFSLNFCILSHFKIINVLWNHWLPLQCILVKYNREKKTWKVFFGWQSLGVQTGIPVSQLAYIRLCMYMTTEQQVSALNNLVFLMFFT